MMKKGRSGLPDRVLAAIEVLALGLWVGALAGFAFVSAPLAFKLIAPGDVHRFALLTATTLAALTLWGYVFGGIALTVAVVRAVDAKDPRWDALRALIVGVALGLAAYEQLVIVPHMTTTPIGSHAYALLHQHSAQVYGAALLLAAIALGLAGARNDDRDKPLKAVRRTGNLLPLQFETADRRRS
jgi:hypothetical protein